MPKLNSINELKELKIRIKSDQQINIPTIVISAGTCGQASGANDIIRITKRELLINGLTDKIHLRITGCHGFCEMEPSVLVEPSRVFYPKVSIENMKRIIKAIYRNEILHDLLYRDPQTGKAILKQDDVPFYKKQKRTLLSKNEKIDPIRLFNYFEVGGYDSFVKILEKGDPEFIIEEIKASGLRGRGGGGFPTGIKWEMLAAQKNSKDKYLVCNGDEGDPGAYMDRSLLEGNPHSILEGMLIGAYATGANKGIIYVRNEYPLAIKHLIIAIRLAHEFGLLGKNILGTGFSFDIEIIRGAGAFVCGEETALISSVEGKMGEPRQRPPFPIEKGIFGNPTAINNVETWANIPVIIDMGSGEYSRIGTKNNSGTKIFSLVGKVKNTGLVEVPMGITIKEIIFDIGGGPSGRAKIKAVQTGGPSGGCIPVEKFDLSIDYDSLSAAGSIMGSGGMIVMDERTCMVDVAKYFTHFLKDESCGKCFVCRKGTQRMYELIEDISMGLGSVEKLDLLEELAFVVKDATMCGLGQTAANPVLSTIKYYRQEYMQHINKKKCPAGVCRDLTGVPCQAACPIGTEAWRYIAHIADGEYDKAYFAIREANPFPSVCARVCSHPCEYMCRSGTSGGEAIAIRALKRFITDRSDPYSFVPVRQKDKNKSKLKIAVVGSGPSGLTAAHYLSLKGYKITVFEKDDLPGGMLTGGIPAYRLPREIINKEINSLIDDNITLKTKTALGTDFTIDDLFKQGFGAVFLSMGAHKSKLLNIEGENYEGVYPAVEFLKAFNLHGKSLAKGRVGIVGGGDSAIDAARVSLRQKEVKNVTILYRRTRNEMPALQHEIDAAIIEGVDLKTLVSPVKISAVNNRLNGVKIIRNRLGDIDAGGRRNPEPIPDSEEFLSFDTLIITIGDVPDVDYISSMNINVNKWGTLIIDEDTLQTNREGVFAGGDVVTGPNTVVDAIAAGKKAAVMIDRYLMKEELKQDSAIKLPDIYIPPVEIPEGDTKRIDLPTIPVEERKSSLKEVELVLSVEAATREAKRCMRCDLEFFHDPAESTKELVESEDIKNG